MLKLFRGVAWCLFAFLFIFSVLLLIIIDEQPIVKREVDITHNQVDRIKQIFDTHRKHVYPGQLGKARITSEDFDTTLNYITYLFSKGNSRTIMTDRNTRISLSIPLSIGTEKSYINIEADFIEADGLPNLKSIKISHFQLPVFIVINIFSTLVHWSTLFAPEIKLLVGALQQIKMSSTGIDIVYRWQGHLFDELNNGLASNLPLVNKEELDRFYRYHLILTKITFQESKPISLSQFLVPVIRQASIQSIKGNAVEENRAAILITTLYILGIPLKTLFPEAANWPKQQKYQVVLDGREDFAKHFMLSAAITVYADTLLSDAIGLYKEVEDARSGSGFSFNDIAADRAGTKFGEKAIKNRVSALMIQAKLMSGLADTDLMPYWLDLPEFLPEATFKAQYGEINSPSYTQLMDKIEQRIARLAILN